MSPSSRSRLRLVLRDTSATAAFASIVLSGSVPSWALVAYGLALLTSLLNRRPLAARPTISVVALLLTAVVLFGAVFRGQMDLVIAACTFAGLVTSHRMLSQSTPGTDQQVHLTSLLMLAGGAALSGELWFGACLAAFAVCSTLSLGLGVIEPEGGSQEHFSVRPLTSRIALGSTLAIAGGLAFFVLFPRLSWNIAARRASPGLGGTTGMSDSVRLGGAGDIKSSPRVVARIKLKPDPGTERLEAYWPGRSFDAFNGREWSGTGVARPSRLHIDLNPTTRARRYVNQQVELMPGYDSRTLIALEQPLGFYSAMGMNTAGTARLGLVEVKGEEVRFASSANAYTYNAQSADAESVPAAELDRPEPYTNPNADTDPRVQQLAERVLGTERRPLQAAHKLQQHLQRDYTYTLELAGEVGDPLADFLFVRKAGHCEHFATALAMLLRSVHIPARVTAGFFGGERIGSSYVLRAGDAHAWTQVFVPGEGWRTVDATPEAGRSGQPQPVLALLTDAYERMQEWWRERVVDYSFQDQVEIARSLVRPPESSGERRSLFPSLPGPKPLAAATLAAIVVYALARRLGVRLRAGPRHAATSFLEDIEAALKKAGIARLPDEPIEELTSRLREGAHPIAPALSKATRAYLGARFGGQVLSREARAQMLEGLC